MNTPRTDALLNDPGNDPYATGWIEHARKLETELAEVKADYQKSDERWIVRENELMSKLEKCRTALDKLHIACETSMPEIYDWYLTDSFASEARENAIEALDQTK